MGSATVHPELRSGARELLLTLAGVNPKQCAWEGLKFTPTLGAAWLREQLVPFADTPVSNGVICHQVLYVVTLFFPSGTGTLAVENMAGALMDLFKVGTRFSHGSTDVLCFKAERSQVQAEPEWLSVRVSVTMQAYTLD